MTTIIHNPIGYSFTRIIWTLSEAHTSNGPIYGSCLQITSNHQSTSFKPTTNIFMITQYFEPLHICESMWRLIPKWPQKLFRISVSSETWKLRFHLVLETTLEHFRNWVSWIPQKLGNHPIPEWPRNPSEIQFPWFLGFLRNSESRTQKLILFLFLITRPLIFYS